MSSRASLVSFAPVAFARNKPKPATENLRLTNKAVFPTIGFPRICRASPPKASGPKKRTSSLVYIFDRLNSPNFDRIALLAFTFPALSASARSCCIALETDCLIA